MTGATGVHAAATGCCGSRAVRTSASAHAGHSTNAALAPHSKRALARDQVQAICEDYRAGASIDREHDEADRGRLIDCPVLVLWGTRGALEPLYGDVLAVWRSWARDVGGRGVNASHFLVEDCPEEVAAELGAFFDRAGRA